MPHLSQLQRDYKDKGLTIVGMTSADKSNTLEAVHKMVKDKADVMAYSVAFDVERKTNEAYMKASGARGIPTSFLVDKGGKIAWIGPPSEADIPISMVIDGSWDYVQGPAMMKKISASKRAIMVASRGEPKRALELFEAFSKSYPVLAKDMDSVHFTILSQLPDKQAVAQKLGAKLVGLDIAAGSAQSLNGLAWGLVDPEFERKDRFLELALRAANAASELTEGKQGAILDTLARVHYWRGELGLALKIQKQAVQYSEGRMQKALKEVVTEYEKALGDRAGV